MITKSIMIGLISAASFLGINNTSDNIIENDDFCRVSCTVSVPDGFGGSIGYTASAGNIFTSCETARERACAKAGRNAIAALLDLNNMN